MKIWITIFTILTLGIGQAQARKALKVGGGIFLDRNLLGGNISLDLPAGEDGFYGAPFIDLFISKSWYQIIDGGIHFLFKNGKPGSRTQFYFGAGGGIGHVRLLGQKKNQPFIDFLGGFEYKMNKKIAIFMQAKLMFFFSDSFVADGMLHNLAPRNNALQAGLLFGLGR